MPFTPHCESTRQHYVINHPVSNPISREIKQKSTLHSVLWQEVQFSGNQECTAKTSIEGWATNLWYWIWATLSEIKTVDTLFANFCNFLKSTIGQWCPLWIVMGMKMRKQAGFELSHSLFAFYTYFCPSSFFYFYLKTKRKPWQILSKQTCFYPYLISFQWSLWLLWFSQCYLIGYRYHWRDVWDVGRLGGARVTVTTFDCSFKQLKMHAVIWVVQTAVSSSFDCIAEKVALNLCFLSLGQTLNSSSL